METEMENPMAESQIALVAAGRRQRVYKGLIADSVVTAGTLWDTDSASRRRRRFTLRGQLRSTVRQAVRPLGHSLKRTLQLGR